MNAFLDGPYLLAFVGTSNGIVQCDSAEHLRMALRDIYPNPGDPTLAFLLNPANWQAGPDGMPYFTEVLVDDGEANDYRIAVYRVMELTS